MPTIAKTAVNAATLTELVRVAAEEYRLKTLQVFKDETKAPGKYSRARTYEQFYRRAREVACGLLRDGLRPGGVVCLMSENRPDWNVADFAILMNGCATAGIYTNDTAEHIKYKLNDTGARAIFIEDAKLLKKLATISPKETPALERVYLMDSRGVDIGYDERIVLFDALRRAGADAEVEAGVELDARAAAAVPSDLARLVYTSGTSGNPKGVMLTHANLLSNAACAGSRLGYGAEDDLLINYLPESHIFQTFLTLAAMMSGVAVGYSFRKTLTFDLPELRPTHFPGVQRVWAKIKEGIEAFRAQEVGPRLSAPALLRKFGMDRVRWFLSGAVKLDEFTYDFFKKELGVTIYEGYGLSETSPVIGLGSAAANKRGSVGLPLENLEVRIVDEGRNGVERGHPGEIAVRGPSVFVGYLNHEEKYREVVDARGWFYTGDRGYLDDDGFLYVLGRAGHCVKFSDGEHHDLEAIGFRVLGYTKILRQIAVNGEGRDYPVAILTLPEDEDDLRRIAKQLGVEYSNRIDFAYHPAVTAACRIDFESGLAEFSAKEKVPAVEVVRKALYIRPFSEEYGEKTPTSKLKLSGVLAKYKKQIDALYESDETFMIHKP
ncbi:MAG: Long-chain-fatty-acid--CoA ligase FadD15 [bacterium ADurb.Bin236]|nr:MAG: Long-chain-fatty-acid--CoA ligase FadD15 [bacterium ADurb.Bin236]HOY62690.1 AMP-binding protein [bacterium]